MNRIFSIPLPGVMQRWIKLLISLALAFGISYGLFAWLVHAEGSRSMYPSGIGGNRANTEWRDSFYGANFLRRRTLLKLYAEAGEVILVGSSAVGVQNGDILIYDPGTVTETPIGDETIPGINGAAGDANFSCENDQRGGGGIANPQGRIFDRAQELAGPDTVPPGGVPGGYVPCVYTATTTGIHHVVFFGPEGDGQDNEGPPTGEVDLASGDNFNENQETSVAAWDVTVRSALDSTTDLTGRLFARYLALFTGGNPQPLESTLFILTPDGYRYRTDLRGLDPFGFIVYGNDTGFLDTDGTPLFHDVVAPQNQLNTPEGGVTLAPPTHYIFFEPPSDKAIQALGVVLTPIVPQIAAVDFIGNLGNNDSTVGAGGTFTYTSNADGTYELIISLDGVDFDPTNPVNRVLYGILPAGTHGISWDGLDNAGNPFPAGLNYPVRITVRAGEYHFPLLDTENSLQGGPQYTLINPPGGTCPSFNGGAPNCNIAFYDDRGYTTASGVDVGTPNVVLAGNNPPNPPRSDPLGGFDTSTTQRAFGDGTGAGFGDKKGLDMWTYFPSEVENTFVNIFAFNLLIGKTDNGITTSPGDVVPYTIVYTNTGPLDATGVEITDTVPANTTFNAGASTAGWVCVPDANAGSVCTLAVGAVAGGTGGSVIFAVNVDDPLPAGVTQLFNSATIGDDGTNGPEPTDDNTATDNTPTTLAIVDPLITKAGNVGQGTIGDLVNFSITISNPSSRSNTSATGVTLTDVLPLELDYVSFSVSSNPAGLVTDSDVTVESNTVSTIGHPSGITQTVATTVTVDIGTLGVDEEVTLNLTTRINDLASPPPLDIINVATMDFNEGNPRSDDATVNVPSTEPEPGDGGDGDGGDGDGDDGGPPPSPTPTPAAAAFVPPAPTPVELPVAFLPETGTKEASSTSFEAFGMLLLTVILVGISLTVLYLRRKSREKRISQ